jgi:osmotically-inducible protein OsmY
MKSHSEIARAVMNELKWDTHVDEANISVHVDGGIVSLTGTVSTWAERSAAAGAAHRVTGVLDVANELDVVPSSKASRSDNEIAHAVRQTLDQSKFIPASRIRTTVSNGFVTLEGDVDLWSQREDAARTIRELAGVVDVVNKLEVPTRSAAAKAK